MYRSKTFAYIDEGWSVHKMAVELKTDLETARNYRNGVNLQK